jgi:hypothetical protein
MSETLPNPQLSQVAICTADVPATLRFYCESFGFVSAGGRVIWGERLSGIQGIDGDAQCLVWWLLGRQDLVQIEVFQHSIPVQKPLPADWRPSDPSGRRRWPPPRLRPRPRRPHR